MNSENVSNTASMIISAIAKVIKDRLDNPDYKFADSFPNSTLSECNIRILHEVLVDVAKKAEQTCPDHTIAYVIQKYTLAINEILAGKFDNSTLAVMITSAYALGPDFDKYIGKIIRIAAILSK